jgi:hypothetical protein
LTRPNGSAISLRQDHSCYLEIPSKNPFRIDGRRFIDPGAQAAHGNSFDHLIGAQQERVWDRQPNRLGGCQIDDQIEFGRLLDGILPGFVPRKILSTISTSRRNKSKKSGP